MFLLALGMTALLGGAPPSLAAQTQGAAQGAARVLAVGEKAEVSWSGGWYKATILEIGEGRYRIRYDGWGSEWDEWVTPSRMRLAGGGTVAAPPAAPRPTAPANPAPPATPATPVKPAAPTTPAKPTSPPPTPSTPKPAPAPKTLSTSPAGRYTCRTWDSGQVNRVGEFLLRGDGTYQDLMYKGSGRYQYEKGSERITFLSGPQKTNAAIRFNAAGHEGKGHIVIDYGGGAKLDCYREALK
jgi:hypothetical protein